MKEKKEKAVNKDVIGFMMQKQKMVKSEKQEQMTQNINKLASNFAIEGKPGATASGTNQ